MRAPTDSPIWIGDVESLEFEEVDGICQAELEFPGARVRVIRYEAGTSVPMHRHTKDNLKIVLRGKMAFEGLDGPLGVVSDLGMYFCGTWYRAEVLEPTLMLLIEETDSARVAYDG